MLHFILYYLFWLGSKCNICYLLIWDGRRYHSVGNHSSQATGLTDSKLSWVWTHRLFSNGLPPSRSSLLGCDCYCIQTAISSHKGELDARWEPACMSHSPKNMISSSVRGAISPWYTNFFILYWTLEQTDCCQIYQLLLL